MADDPRFARGAGLYRLGVIGDPVAHSLSPALHQPALDLLGVPAIYERWPTSVDALTARIEGLRDPRVLGANVTVPHKVETLRLVDEVSATARRAGAVNTIVNREGTLFGDNTDVHGFMASLTETLGATVPAKATVLGAGGAARAVVLALEALGVNDIVVVNRDRARATALVRALAPAPVRLPKPGDEHWPSELEASGLLVNATSLGWHGDDMPLDPALLRRLPPRALVADLTYRETALLRVASAVSLPTVDGLAMLVHQGARAFELFTGVPAPLAAMLDAARRARAGA